MTQRDRNHVDAIPGSWDSAIRDALVLSRRGDEEAIERFDRFCDRLLSYGKERRLARQGELQTVLEFCLAELQSLYFVRGRFDEAADVFAERLDEELERPHRIIWSVRRAVCLEAAERQDEATRLFENLLETYPGAAHVVAPYFRVLLNRNDLDTAENLLSSFLGVTIEMDKETGENGDADFAHYLVSNLAAVQGDWRSALHHFRQSAPFEEGLEIFRAVYYLRLIDARQFERFVSLLSDEPDDVLTKFWRGLSLFEQEEVHKAHSLWEKVATLSSETVEVRHFREWIYAHYYLGDEDRYALEICLRMMQSSESDPDADLLALTALGWALQGDYDQMKANLQFAREFLQRNFEDGRLPWSLGFHFRNLMPSTQFAEIADRFDRAHFGDLYLNVR